MVRTQRLLAPLLGSLLLVPAISPLLGNGGASASQRPREAARSPLAAAILRLHVKRK